MYRGNAVFAGHIKMIFLIKNKKASKQPFYTF